MRHLHAALIALIAASTALAATSGREPLALKEPAWKGSGPDAVTPDYREALAMLQAIASEGADGPPLRVTSPSPCVLRLERGDDVARFADEGRAFLHQVTWIDLARASAVEAQSFGSAGTKVVSAAAATCAWLEGSAGFALSTEVIARGGSATALRRVELAREEQPRLCVGGGVGVGELTAPLRALLASCAGPGETGKGAQR